MQLRQPSRTTPVVHQSTPARRPLEAPVIDMEEIWASQQTENAKWLGIYSSLIQGALLGAILSVSPKTGDSDAREEESIDLDYEALALEADHAYSRYAARIRSGRR